MCVCGGLCLCVKLFFSVRVKGMGEGLCDIPDFEHKIYQTCVGLQYSPDNSPIGFTFEIMYYALCTDINIFTA